MPSPALHVLAALLAFGTPAAGAMRAPGTPGTTESQRPNVLLIVADDQGFGDLGIHGNPVIETPHLDCLAMESVAFARFYVHPVCSPSRASLMTGRYPFRTGAIDTSAGRARMRADELTLAEMLAAAGWRTAIFGKWHLGDTWPLRPQDQGFETSLVHRGGGLAQPSDPPGWRDSERGSRGREAYFDPALWRDGVLVDTQGYVTDVLTDAAIEFLREPRDAPFFLYLPFNAPHTPLEVPEEDLALYAGRDLSPARFPSAGRPVARESDPERVARVYGMITNLDRNVGRLLAALAEEGLADDTLVVYLSDNGPQDRRFNAGLRGGKGRVYEGGIRVPCFVRWPGRLAPRTVGDLSAHVDLAPTILAACGVAPPADVQFDGVDLWPWLAGRAAAPLERTLFLQWHRGDEPEPWRSCAVLSGRWKLVQPGGAGSGEDRKLELYHVDLDPWETSDRSAAEPALAHELSRRYARWFEEATAAGRWAAPAVTVGSPYQNPVELTRQDRSGVDGWWPAANGYWDLDVYAPGTFSIELLFLSADEPGTATLVLGGHTVELPLPAGAETCSFEDVRLGAGRMRLMAWRSRGAGRQGVRYVRVHRTD